MNSRFMLYYFEDTLTHILDGGIELINNNLEA